MFLHVLLLAVALQRSYGAVRLTLDDRKMTLNGLNPDTFAAGSTSYTFAEDEWMVIQYTRKGYINKFKSYTNTRMFQFMRQDQGKLVFKNKKDKEMKFTVREFTNLVENFKVFKPLVNSIAILAPTVSVVDVNDVQKEPGHLTIEGMHKPWQGTRTCTAKAPS